MELEWWEWPNFCMHECPRLAVNTARKHSRQACLCPSSSIWHNVFVVLHCCRIGWPLCNLFSTRPPSSNTPPPWHPQNTTRTPARNPPHHQEAYSSSLLVNQGLSLHHVLTPSTCQHLHRSANSNLDMPTSTCKLRSACLCICNTLAPNPEATFAAAASLAIPHRTSFARYRVSTESTLDPQIARLRFHTNRNVNLPLFRCFHIVSPLDFEVLKWCCRISKNQETKEPEIEGSRSQ